MMPRSGSAAAALLLFLALVHIVARPHKPSPGRPLHCLVCSANSSAWHASIDARRRISYGVPGGRCHRHEPVTCLPWQDACASIVDFYYDSYQVTKGCSTSKKYPALTTKLAQQRNSACFSSSSSSSSNNEKRRLSSSSSQSARRLSTCICGSDFCNFSTSVTTMNVTDVGRWSMVVALTTVVLLVQRAVDADLGVEL